MTGCWVARTSNIHQHTVRNLRSPEADDGEGKPTLNHAMEEGRVDNDEYDDIRLHFPGERPYYTLRIRGSVNGCSYGGLSVSELVHESELRRSESRYETARVSREIRLGLRGI